jgi:beta-glucosidase
MTAFPDGFLWGTATAAHQVEGNNVNSDLWVMEHAEGSIFSEPSGDACDHYRLYRQDLATLRDLGFNSYRFSIEWARVEPEEGFISKAALRHYGDVLDACWELGLTPMVTLHHFASPRWLMKRGGWESPETPARFAAYSRAVMEELGSRIPYVGTINEGNIPSLIRFMNMAALLEGGDAQAPVGVEAAPGDNPMTNPAWIAACAAELGTPPDKLKPFLFAASAEGQATVMDAHARAREAIKAVRPETQVGMTLAVQDIQVLPGGEAIAQHVRQELLDGYLPALAGDDYLGIQNYSRLRVGPQGPLPNEPGVPVTQMGYEYYPEALEGALRQAAIAGLPMIVTENGLGSDDDAARIEFVRRALEGVQRTIADGLDVRGYVYWSAMDNYEWMMAYRPKFGLLSVDRDTQERHVKESGRYLGAIARANAMPAALAASIR